MSHVCCFNLCFLLENDDTAAEVGASQPAASQVGSWRLSLKMKKTSDFKKTLLYCNLQHGGNLTTPENLKSARAADIFDGLAFVVHDTPMQENGWLNLSDYNGIIPGGESQNIDLNFMLNDLVTGDYNADLILNILPKPLVLILK